MDFGNDSKDSSSIQLLFFAETKFPPALSANRPGIGALVMNRSTSMPKSVLRHDVDKDLYCTN